MSNMRDAPVLKAVADVVKQHVGAVFKSLGGRIDAIESQIKSLPKPENGEKGDQGAIGPVGPAGSPGEKGLDGRDGAIGLQGPIGPVGPAGKDGIGIVGESGPPGLNGKDGAPGRDGIDGAQGNQGEKGLDGAAGCDGKDGAEGAKGLDGVNGKDGKDGSNGINGKDAPAVDTDALSAAIFEKVLGAVPKPKDGVDGKDGASVDPEAVRTWISSDVNKAVSALPKPENGRDGRDGRNGSPGLPGKDADEIDVLPGIDESSAYQKGTRAEYRGGEIRAVRTTDPIVDGDIEAAGWSVTRNGIHDIVEEMAPDGRTKITSWVMTSGKSIVTKCKIYVPQHKGVWSASNAYELGDYVTMAGAQWHSNRTNKDRPGTSDAWTLVVKRGSDGKDLTNGTRQ